MKVFHTGLREETLNFIKYTEAFQEAVFVPVDEGEISSCLESEGTPDIFLIGEGSHNPIQAAQKVYGQDPLISIIIINEPANFQKIRQALLFTPFIGPTVHSISNAAGKGIVEVVKDHVQRTRQRRNYRKFQSNVTKVSVPFSQKLEQVKSDYLNKVLQEVPVGIALINKNGNILSFNSCAADIFKKSEREVVGHLLADLFSEGMDEDLSVFFQDEVEVNLQKTVRFQAEDRLQFLELVLSRVEKDDPSFKVVLIKDITDQVLAQKSLEESAQKVRVIVDSMPEMAWTALPDGEIDYLNKRWFEFTGQGSESSVDNWLHVIHSEDLPEVLSAWKEALQKESMFQVECRYLRAVDQSYRWHLVRALPVQNKDGRILHWVGTCTDIQGLKNVEEELQKTTEELAASNEELTASNEELNETNERLVQVNSDLDNFIYTASHDLKAPIANIEGLVHILERKLRAKERDSTKVSAIMEMIKSSIERFKKTIGDLTEVSKLQRLSELESIQIKVPEVIKEVELDLHQQIQEAGADVEHQFQDHSVLSFSYKNFKSIVYNLLSNAIKYRSINRKLEVKILFYLEEGYHVLSVQDNGLGMNLKDEEKIFGMFQRMHSHVEGTGIGLYIVKKMVENAGGRITVESQLDSGSTFKVYFPVKKAEPLSLH